MKIRLRQLKNKNGTVSLRLDTFMGYYTDAYGKRKAKRIRETLPFHLPPEETVNFEEEKEKLIQKANQIIQEKEEQLIISGQYPFSETKAKKAFFIPYLENLVSIKISNKKNNDAVWMGMLRWYKVFTSPVIQFKSLNENHCLDFYHFLEQTAQKSNGTPLANSTIRLYYQKFQSVVQQAYLDGRIKEMPAQPKAFKEESKKHKVVLKQYETVALQNAPFSNKDVKNAFLLSLETGIKLGLLRTLQWKDIQHEREEWTLKLVDKVTKKCFYYPIPDYYKKFLGEPKEDTNLVFPLLRTASEANVQLLKWVIQAGIAKHITFECARNTFAYNKLVLNTPTEKIQQYLGHKNIKTTEKFIEQLNVELPDINKEKSSKTILEKSAIRRKKRTLNSSIKKQLKAYSYQF